MTGNPEAASSGDPGLMLTAFRRALAREMYVLRRQPRLLCQQLYNRLQWEDEPVHVLLRPEFERRSVLGAIPWLRIRTRFHESEALLRTLAGHASTVNACAFSPDGARLVSASTDGTLKLWYAETGKCLATLPLPGSVLSVTHHPRRAMVVCDDFGGSLHIVELVGIAIGPLVVTAVDLGDNPFVRCPVCFKHYPLQEAWLGREIDCPGKKCHARLRVNPFVARRPSATPK